MLAQVFPKTDVTAVASCYGSHSFIVLFCKIAACDSGRWSNACWSWRHGRRKDFSISGNSGFSTGSQKWRNFILPNWNWYNNLPINFLVNNTKMSNFKFQRGQAPFLTPMVEFKPHSLTISRMNSNHLLAKSTFFTIWRVSFTVTEHSVTRSWSRFPRQENDSQHKVWDVRSPWEQLRCQDNIANSNIVSWQLSWN